MNYEDYSGFITPDWQNERAAEQIRRGQIPRGVFDQPTPEEIAADISGREMPLPGVARQIPDIRTPDTGPSMDDALSYLGERAPGPVASGTPPIRPDSPLARDRARAAGQPPPAAAPPAGPDLSSLMFGGGMDREIRDVAAHGPDRSSAPQSRVQVTVGGKSYDYAGGQAGNAPMQGSAGPGSGEGFGQHWNQPAESGGVSTMGKPFLDPYDIEEAQKARVMKDLTEDPYTAYQRKAEIDRQKAIGIERGKSDIHRDEIGNLLGEQDAIGQQIDAEAEQKRRSLPPTMTAEQRAAALTQIDARAAEAKRMFQQQLGLATGKAPSTLYKEDGV